jgi:hypothetical protein
MELFDRFEFEDINARTIAAGGEKGAAPWGRPRRFS